MICKWSVCVLRFLVFVYTDTSCQFCCLKCLRDEGRVAVACEERRLSGRWSLLTLAQSVDEHVAAVTSVSVALHGGGVRVERARRTVLGTVCKQTQTFQCSDLKNSLLLLSYILV